MQVASYARFSRRTEDIDSFECREIYQIKQNEILHGLKDIAVLAVDILVYGRGHTVERAIMDHNRKLRELFIRLREKNSKLNK